MTELQEHKCPNCNNFMDVLIDKAVKDDQLKVRLTLEPQDANRWEGRVLMKQLLKEKGLY